MTEEVKHEAMMQALKGRKEGGRLEQWRKIGEAVYALCYDDPQKRFGNGKEMRTSMVEEVNEEAGYLVTRNTFYLLGRPGTDKEIREIRDGMFY